MSRTLEGKVAMVTGAGRGIGRAVVLKLASEGARIVANDLDAAPVAELIAEVRARGGDAQACPGSVTTAEFAERAVGMAIATYGATSGQALAGVVGPLIEVPVLVGLVYVSLALRTRVFPAASMDRPARSG